MTRSDEEWKRALLGQPGTGSEGRLVSDLSDRLRRSLARAFGSQLSDADLDDLTQASLVRIREKIDTFEGRSRFTTWATSVAVNEALHELRRRRFQHVDIDAAVAAGAASLRPVGPDRAQRARRDVLLQEAIDVALTDRQRTAVLAELGGLPLAEIAPRMGTSRGALYKLLHDGRRRLLAHFESRGLGADDLMADPEEVP